MKKPIWTLLLTLFTLLLFAETITIGTGENKLSLLSASESETIIQYQMGLFETETVKINGQDWVHPTLPKEGITQEKGFPQLPVLNRSIVIPNTADISIEVYDVSYQDFHLKVAPSKGVITRDVNPATIPYTFDPIYKADEFYPQRIASLSEPYILKDYRGITLLTTPFAYNPISQTLRVYTSFKIRAITAGFNSQNAILHQRTEVSRAFIPIYESHFINWERYRYTPVNDSFGKMLVICHSDFSDTILPYVNWKRQKGIETELIEWSSIGSTAAQLKTYIQNRYNSDSSISFIQIVGDAPQIPSLTSGGGGSDPSFSLVAGNDNYPDIFIGRFSAQSTADLNAQINKVIAYERDASPSDTWLARGMGLASNEGGSGADNDETDIQHMNVIRNKLLNYGYTTVDQIYDPGAIAATVTANVNAGRGVINYVGHGADTYWVTTGFSNTNATNLSNGMKAPVIMDVACVNGNFVSQTCFAEAWQRNPNGGSAAIYASSINQSWASPMRAQDHFTDLLIAESKTTIGGLYYNASCNMMDTYSTDGVNMFKTWHIFGDASMQMRTKAPLAMNVSHPTVITSGTSSITVNTGVANALVGITYNNTIYGRGYSNSSGSATISLVSPPAGVITYTITVTAFNRVSYIGAIQQMAASGPYLSLVTFSYADGANATPEYDETGSLNLSIRNVGTSVATGVSATLSSSSPHISITTSSVLLGTINAGTTSNYQNLFSFNISDNVPNLHQAAFTLTMRSGTSTWTEDFEIQINSPELRFGDFTLQNLGANGIFDPGETVSLSIPLYNDGNATTPFGSVSLTCSIDDVTIQNPIQNISPISAMGSTTISFTLSAASTIPLGTVVQLNFLASFGAYTANSSGNIEIGPPIEAIIGTGTGSNSSSTACPINVYYRSLHGQSVYTKAELNSAGITGPMDIAKIGFNVTGIPLYSLPNFLVRMGHTSATNVSSWIPASSLTTVFTTDSFAPASTGWNMLTLDSPFRWNGTDNIVIDTAFGITTNYSFSGTVQYTSISYGYRYARQDTQDQTNVFTSGSSSSYRPNVKFALNPIPTGPAITASPGSISETVYSGESASIDLTLSNVGTAPLSWNTSASFATWSSVNPTSGTIPAGGSANLTISLDSDGLGLQTYTASLVINSNALENPQLSIPVSLTIEPSPYPNQPRMVAEWEPAQGSLIRYPFGQPNALITELSNASLLYVIVSSSSQSACNSSLSSMGANMSNVRYINAASDSYWTRDYGPWTVFDADNQMKLIDFNYNRPRPNDNLIPSVVANQLSIPYYYLPLNLTGGNMMADGMGKAMSSSLVLTENSSYSQAQINQMFQNYLGISEYQLYTDPLANSSIDHIDCWAKLLDVDKVIIIQVPSNHTNYSAIESQVAIWQSRISSYGTPYRIYRVYAPNNEPYANSFILNNKIYVPQMGTAYDAAALQSYGDAMPGYTVTGYTHSNYIADDALHCRVNTIFDPQLIHISHTPVNTAMENSSLAIDVTITHTSSLNPSTSRVFYRHGSSGSWQSAPLTLVSGNLWNANIQTPAFGQTLQYYIQAFDTTGRSTLMPLCAGNDPFQFVIDQQQPNRPPVLNLPDSISFPMNEPYVVDFASYTSDPDGDDLYLSCTGNTNIQVAIDALSVTFSTLGDWYGTENIVFYLSDGLETVSAQIPVTAEYIVTHLEAPELHIQISPLGALLTWNSITDASYYQVFRAPNASGAYTPIAETSSPSWLDTDTPARAFYYVKAFYQPLTKAR